MDFKIMREVSIKVEEKINDSFEIDEELILVENEEQEELLE